VADHLQVEDQAAHTHHIVPPPVYIAVYAALLVLLVVTYLVSKVELGPFNIVVAMIIAVAKTMLIVLFFMHLRWSTQMVRFFAGAALFWLAILFVLTMNDYFSRLWFKLPNT
jgi:cytochrome c oxidase subunit IV